MGALNAALFLQGNLEKAEEVWLNITPEKILTVDPLRYLEKVKSRLPNRLFSSLNSLCTKFIGHGWFSREGLLRIIRQDVNLSIISNSHIHCYATCLHADRLEVEYFQINGYENDHIESILLASSAIPFIFDPVEINGEMYWDGGVPLPNSDNIPVRPLYEIGCDLIFVVHLSRENPVEHEHFPNAQIIEIIPQEDQGGFFDGTLDFTSSGSQRRMKQGYDDAKRILQPIFDMVIVQSKIYENLISLRKKEQSFLQQRKTLLNERDKLKQDLCNYLKM
ncbi:patatin-like phospholipase family protein [Bacillus methanolicus]|uniref:patatin-like phospholipase family protein n=1 Tax=Bacillus methanolicus TaxID=1471 RepID=UPI00200BD565|nr:patatin-like phospholipase family protein [Bacillus methanolicus]UQD50946.1 patatin-like phospholipase family protein [Bacillus methanolicus]